MKWRLAVGAGSLAAGAAGAVALAAAAVAVAAIGSLVIGRLGVGTARFERIEIDELIVRKLTIVEGDTGDVSGTP